MPSSASDRASPPAAAACKGKAMAGAEGVPCGICLTDSRRAIRGELDCCAHHFCFVCIMAWARVESRCPFCKAHFRTIRRPPVPGRLPAERLVAVAQRVQVWHPLGNESSMVGADPSASSGCSVCGCANDEDLLLLCELCDVAAHTYCVGLGTAVPEGDWFCNDCATSKEEHSRCQEVDDVLSTDQEELEIAIQVPTHPGNQTRLHSTQTPRNRSIEMDAARFGFGRTMPRAFKFDPTDDDIVAHYLLPRTLGDPDPPFGHAVIDADPASLPPAGLFARHRHATSQHAFFIDVNATGGRRDRDILGGAGGTWRGQQKHYVTLTLQRPGGGELDIEYKRYDLTYKRFGEEDEEEGARRKKRKRKNGGTPAGWVMHEYQIVSPPLHNTVLTRIKRKADKIREDQQPAQTDQSEQQQVFPATEHPGPSYDSAEHAHRALFFF